jgi:hypothetical protein
MSLDYLEDLTHEVDQGKSLYACPGVHAGEWHISNDLNDLTTKAQRTANSRKFDVQLFRLVNKMDTVSGDSYLVVRKILEPGPRGEPHLQWALVDTREAAEIMRDVSQGPTPYFGATVEKSFKPAGQ